MLLFYSRTQTRSPYFTPTFSSKSLICLLWISVLSSRSRILCKRRKVGKVGVFLNNFLKRPTKSRTHFASATWWAWWSSSILSWRIWQSYSRLFLNICLLSFSTDERSSSFCISSRGSPYFITWRKEGITKFKKKKKFKQVIFCISDALIQSIIMALLFFKWNKFKQI